MPLNALLTAIFALLNPIRTTYHLRAPQDTVPPYFVVQLVGGPVLYCFGGASIERQRVQITQYHPWTGKPTQALTDNAAIVAALDLKPLTVAGIIIRRLGKPAQDVQDERGKPPVLQVHQDWLFDYQA